MLYEPEMDQNKNVPGTSEKNNPAMSRKKWFLFSSEREKIKTKKKKKEGEGDMGGGNVSTDGKELFVGSLGEGCLWELARWLGSEEHLLLRNWVWFLTPTY